MRVMVCLLALVLPAPLLAAEEAPSEAAVVAATRNLLQALEQTDASRRLDLAQRFLDVDAFLNRAFGEDAQPERERLRPLLLTTLSGDVFKSMSRPDAAETKLLSVALDGGLRQVTFRAEDKTIQLLWAGTRGAPRLVDYGTSESGLLTALLKKGWQAAGASPLAFLTGTAPRLQLRQSKDNIRTLLTLMIGTRTMRASSGWPRYSGKSFILSVLLTDALDRGNKKHIAILFSPADKQRSLEKTNLERYKDVTKASLKAGTKFGELTSYAGRRNTEREYVVTPDQEKAGTAVIADLSFPDVAIVGFTNGAVRTMTRKELGLGPDDPIVVGEKSKSGILRQLSDE